MDDIAKILQRLTQELKEDNDKAEEKENARRFVRSLLSNTTRRTGDDG